MSLTHTGGTTPAALDPCGREEHPDCGIRDVLDRIGDKWSVLVVMLLGERGRRFGELNREAGGISKRMLSLTLKRLERAGLISRTVHETLPPSVFYALTPLGRSLWPRIEALGHWAVDNHTIIEVAREQFDGDVDERRAVPGASQRLGTST